MHILLLVCILGLVRSEVEIESAARLIDLTTQITNVTIEFKGISGLSKEFLLPIDHIHFDRIAAIKALSKSKALDVKLGTNKLNGFNTYVVTLPSPVDQMTIQMSLFHSQVPKPSEILQGETQYAKFSANSFILCPHVILKQETTVQLPSGQMLMYSAPEKPASKSDKKITYGPYTSKPAFSETLFNVQFQIVDNLMTITKMTRLIEVSHWGNIAVEEEIEIYNSGPTLKGPFSRLDYMHGIGVTNAVRMWNTLLPASAKDIYYRDLIGNVSTSMVNKLYSAVQLQIVPRFPVMGGWRTFYTIGYNVPAHEYLYRDGSNYLLKMRVIDHIHNSQFVEDFTLKIILPEAISEVKLHTPFEMQRLADTKMPTYLDVTGREVITLKAKNLIDSHIQEFTVTYQFAQSMMLREFGMAISGFLILFFSMILYVRLDFSVSKNAQKESTQRTQALLSELIKHQERRKACYQAYESSLSSYKIGKNLAKFNTECKEQDTEREKITKAIGDIKERLRALWSEGSEKVQELQELDKNYRESFKSCIHLAENLMNNRINKIEYQQQETELNGKLSHLLDKMNGVVASF